MYPGRECAIRARSEAPATKQQKEWLQTELVAPSNAPFMIAGRKADLRIYWAKLDDSKTYPGRECAIRARSEAPATKQQK